MTRYEDMVAWSSQGKCYRCKQKMKVVFAGLINMTQFCHDRDDCELGHYNIHSCPYCGKDLNILQ